MLLSYSGYFFYKLRKILYILFHFDGTWKLALVTALIFTFGLTIFSPATAQETATSVADKIIAGCGSTTATLPSALNFAASSFIGTVSCDRLTSADSRRLVGDPAKYSITAPVVDPKTGKTSNVDVSQYYRYGGAVSAFMYIGGATSDLRPASTYDSVVTVARNAGFASAQVIGENQFAPIATLWGVFRNIALLLFVVVFVAIGFFILIQRKIGGQETVSLVSSIVNASVAMIVIVFSYAIGGLIADIFINVMNGVVATTFNGFINSNQILDQLNIAGSGVNVLSLMKELSNIGVSQSAANLFQSALTGLNYPVSAVKDVFQGFNSVNVGFLPVGAAVGMFSSAFVDILMGIVNSGFNNNALLNAIIAFVIFIVMLRVVFALIGAYIGLVFKIMFAPFILLPAALPGNAGKVILGWIMSLIATALTFPAVFACILMSAMFLNLNSNVSISKLPDGTDFSYTSNCSYNSQLNPSNPGIIQGNERGSSKFLVVRETGSGTAKNAFGESPQCYPIALPAKFNFWPAPLGYMEGVEPDSLIRFVIALAFIVLTPNVPKILQAILKVPQDNILSGVSQGFKSGAGAFSQFISSVPSFGVGRAIGSITRGAADSAT